MMTPNTLFDSINNLHKNFIEGSYKLSAVIVTEKLGAVLKLAKKYDSEHKVKRTYFEDYMAMTPKYMKAIKQLIETGYDVDKLNELTSRLLSNINGINKSLIDGTSHDEAKNEVIIDI